MATKIKDTGKAQARIETLGPHEKKVDPEVVSEALGASLADGEEVEKKDSPFAFLALWQEITQRLESSGGRPKLSDTTTRPKIPLSDRDWERLKEIAEQLRAKNVAATPGQVASVLLHRGIESLDIAAFSESDELTHPTE